MKKHKCMCATCVISRALLPKWMMSKHKREQLEDAFNDILQDLEELSYLNFDAERRKNVQINGITYTPIPSDSTNPVDKQ